MLGGIIIAVLWQLFVDSPIPVAGVGVALSFALTIVVSLLVPKSHIVLLPPLKNDL